MTCRFHASDRICNASLKKVNVSQIAGHFVTWQLKFQKSNIAQSAKSVHTLCFKKGMLTF